MGEMDTIRQRQRHMSTYIEELEKKAGESEEQINELQETIQMQLTEITHEKRGKERVEAEAQQLQEEIIAKKGELEVRKLRCTSRFAIHHSVEEILFPHLRRDRAALTSRLRCR